MRMDFCSLPWEAELGSGETRVEGGEDCREGNQESLPQPFTFLLKTNIVLLQARKKIEHTKSEKKKKKKKKKSEKDSNLKVYDVRICLRHFPECSVGIPSRGKNRQKSALF